MTPHNIIINLSKEQHLVLDALAHRKHPDLKRPKFFGIEMCLWYDLLTEERGFKCFICDETFYYITRDQIIIWNQKMVHGLQHLKDRNLLPFL